MQNRILLATFALAITLMTLGCVTGSHPKPAVRERLPLKSLTVDLGAEKAFGGVFVSEADDRVEEFAFQVKRGDVWRPFLKGSALGENFLAHFPPLTARYVRLNITKAKGVPTILEFQVLEPKTAKKKGE
ncbi:MAG: discoidin domain-containing protein [Phycisphaerales bacterium]|jgi:hypothetical protein|nr:discoidin domain-containing protein [Phycisphaerales bacterium]